MPCVVACRGRQVVVEDETRLWLFHVNVPISGVFLYCLIIFALLDEF